jgi:hypothetical protein
MSVEREYYNRIQQLTNEKKKLEEEAEVYEQEKNMYKLEAESIKEQNKNLVSEIEMLCKKATYDHPNTCGCWECDIIEILQKYKDD